MKQHYRSIGRFLTQAPHRDRRQTVRPRRRLLLEQLEARLVLATVSWNSDQDGFWDAAENWLDESNVSRVPGPQDDVVIDREAANPGITVRNGEQSVRSLMSRERIVITGGSLSLDESSEL